MLLSRQKKFLFVHIQKTAGSSLRKALHTAIADLAPFLGTHDHVAWATQHLDFQSYFKAAFVRNPWDRLVSWYCMIREQQTSTNRFWEYVRNRANSFDDFLLHCTDTIDDHDGRKSILYNQVDYLSDERGRLLVDFVGRFEALAADSGVFSPAWVWCRRSCRTSIARRIGTTAVSTPRGHASSLPSGMRETSKFRLHL